MKGKALLAALLTVVIVVTPGAIARADDPRESISQSPSSSATETSSTAEQPALWDLPGRAAKAVTGWVNDLAFGAIGPILDLFSAITSTPRLDADRRIHDLWALSLAIADSALILFALVGSGVVTAGGELWARVTLKEILPRLLVAAAASNLSLKLVGQMIALSNTLSSAMLKGAVGDDPRAITHKLAEALTSAPQGNPFLVLLLLAVLVIGVLVVVSYVVRTAVLVLLCCGAPLVLCCHALPQTDGVARLWWRATVALLVAPVAQAMLMTVAFRVFLTSEEPLGMPSAGGLIDILVLGSLLYLLFKIPFWSLNLAFKSSTGSRAWGNAKQKAGLAVKALKVAA